MVVGVFSMDAIVRRLIILAAVWGGVGAVLFIAARVRRAGRTPGPEALAPAELAFAWPYLLLSWLCIEGVMLASGLARRNRPAAASLPGPSFVRPSPAADD